MSVFNSYLGGLQSGQNLVERGRAAQYQKQNAFNQAMTQQSTQAVNAQKIETGRKEAQTKILNDTVSYVRKMPLEQREQAAKRYLGMRGADAQMVAQLEQAGHLSAQSLTDQNLDAFTASLRGEMVLKDKEALIGRDGKAIYENRYNAPQVVADGSALVGDDGKALYENTKDVAPASPTSDMQNYQAAKDSGFTGSFNDYQIGLKTAGKAETNVTVGGGQTKGQEKVDAAYADDFIAWRQGGGSDNAKLTDQLKSALGTLQSGANVSGAAVGNVPDIVQAFINPDAVDTRDKVAEVVQRNLRLVLGAQFTEKEGQMLIARAYNPRLDESVNAKRVSALIDQIDTAAQQKESAAQYWEANGTLTGWTGKMPNRNDFEKAIDGAGGGESSAADPLGIR